MSQALLTFSSSTTANRLKKLAGGEAIRGIALVQTPKALSQNGCAYSLRCPFDSLSSLLELAHRFGIRHGQVYRELVDQAGRKLYEKL